MTMPVPRDVTAVHGCNCGGLTSHSTACTIFELPPEQAKAAMDDAEARLHRWTDALNNQLTVVPEVAATREQEQHRLVASLILGEAQILGKRVELAWPDGLPHGFTEEQLRDYARGLPGRD